MSAKTLAPLAAKLKAAPARLDMSLLRMIARRSPANQLPFWSERK
jgi:hypothetical protein